MKEAPSRLGCGASAAWKERVPGKFRRVLQWALKQRNLVESAQDKQSGAIGVHGDQEELCVGAIEERGRARRLEGTHTVKSRSQRRIRVRNSADRARAWAIKASELDRLAVPNAAQGPGRRQDRKGLQEGLLREEEPWDRS